MSRERELELDRYLERRLLQSLIARGEALPPEDRDPEPFRDRFGVLFSTGYSWGDEYQSEHDAQRMQQRREQHKASRKKREQERRDAAADRARLRLYEAGERKRKDELKKSNRKGVIWAAQQRAAKGHAEMHQALTDSVTALLHPGRVWNLSDPFDLWEYQKKIGVPESRRRGTPRGGA